MLVSSFMFSILFSVQQKSVLYSLLVMSLAYVWVAN